MRAMVGASESPLYAWMRYHLGWEDRDGRQVEQRRGKMMRPVGLLMVTDALGGDVEQAAPAAAAVELIHNFSLLHDDIEDDSEFRHGRPTVWTFAGQAQAINTGDGMYTVARIAQHRLMDAGVPGERVLAVMRELDEACLRLVEGQYLDISFETRNDVNAGEYVEMAQGKTAAMFAGPLAAGAILAGASDDVTAAFRTYGRHVGLAFQAIDDVLGIWGDEAVTGKPVGDDLRSRKMTYPVILALTAEGEAAARLRDAYRVRTVAGEDTSALAALVEATGAREATVAMAQREEGAALDALAAAGVSEDVRALCTAFAESAIGRVA
jgi:geranylgeranyl diphosphate synthase type I